MYLICLTLTNITRHEPLLNHAFIINIIIVYALYIYIHVLVTAMEHVVLKLNAVSLIRVAALAYNARKDLKGDIQRSLSTRLPT